MKAKIKTILLIGLLAAFVPLSMDLYLPALPQMMNHFNSNELILNSTLYLFYLGMAIGMIFLGPLSDTYGRKALLIPCALVYSLASVACAFAFSVWVLIAFRMLQALAVGCLMALSTAMIKDSFEGAQMEAILGITQAMSLVAPMVAPVLGAVVLQFFSWQAEFIILALIGVVSLALSLFQSNTIDVALSQDAPPKNAFQGIGSALKDRRFIAMLLATSIIPVGYMAYVSASSYIYQNQFGLNEMTFSLFYALNASVTVAASLAYMKARTWFSDRVIMTSILICTTLSGVLICLVGSISALIFMLCFLPNAFFCTLLKPFATSLLLNMRQTEAGTTSSLINFAQTLFSCLGLTLGSIAWPNMALGLGATMTVACVLGIIALLITAHKKTEASAASE